MIRRCRYTRTFMACRAALSARGTNPGSQSSAGTRLNLFIGDCEMKRVFKSFLLLGLALAITAPVSAGDGKDKAKDAKAAVKDKQAAAKDGQGEKTDKVQAKTDKAPAKTDKAPVEKGVKGDKAAPKEKKAFNPADAVLKKLAAAKWTEEQTAKAREIGTSFREKFSDVYAATKPTKEQATAMKEAAAQAQKDGKDKKAAFKAAMEAANWTDEQKAAKAEAQKLRGEFMASIMDLLTDEQKASLQQSKAAAKKKGSTAKGDKAKPASDKVKKAAGDKVQKPAGNKAKAIDKSKKLAAPSDKKLTDKK